MGKRTKTKKQRQEMRKRRRRKKTKGLVSSDKTILFLPRIPD